VRGTRACKKEEKKAGSSNLGKGGTATETASNKWRFMEMQVGRD
jgi:hypothetical protein